MAAGLAAPGASRAQPVTAVQSLESIQAAAEQFVRAQLPATNGRYYIAAMRLDPRLRLAACSVPPEGFAGNGTAATARTTVGVRCTGAAAWTVYVPVNVEHEAPVLVLRRDLSRRARVELTDVELQTRRLPGAATNFVSDVTNLQGHRLKRSMTAGTPLTVEALVPDVLVHRGQQVTLIAASGPIEIRAQGQALTEGAASDRVRVQNVTSLKVVEGVVETAGVVRVGL